MAGLGLPGPARHFPPASNQPLPTGPCNHRDVGTGACGCVQFWDKCSTELHQGSREDRSSSERSTWCVCGHHACFHSAMMAVVAHAPTRCDGRCRLHSTAQCDIHKPARWRLNERPPPSGSQPGYNGSTNASHVSPSQRLIRSEASQTNGPGIDEGGRDSSSQPSTSGLPRVPSMCLLSNDRYPAANGVARDDTNQSRQTVAGLGLSLMNIGDEGNSIDRQQSVASTVPDDVDMGRPTNVPNSEPEMPSTRANSVADEQVQMTSPAPGPLSAVLEYNRNLHLDVSGDTIPNTFHLEDFIHSATEVATPSIANTPDLAAADKAVYEGKKFVEDLIRLTSNVEQRNGTDARPASARSAPSPQLLLTNSPGVSPEQLQSVLRSASPHALQKIVSYLAPLHNLLNSMPNVANTLTELNDRLSLLESNNSFNYVHPDDHQQQYDTLDGRLIAVENWTEDHDKLHQAIDADHSSHSVTRRGVTDSFGSNRSVQSTTSDALILAAMNRKDMVTEIGGIKDRLDILEAAALPTSFNPWEVEVVLLPWGRDLRGIWFFPDEPMHDLSMATTQDSEEWTQARSATLGQSRAPLGPLRDSDSSAHPSAGPSSRSSHPFSDTQSGWSSQAISDWALGSSDELLSPKACGRTTLVYKRLRSRGFIKDVTLKSASAKDIQATLLHAFKELLEHLRCTEEEDDLTINSYPALRAPFIPLRKVLQDSRLRFLTPAEMASSALWSAQFLASGVLMRVSGGKKRLYVTQREAYVQARDQAGSSWTWQEVRQLPRHQTDSDSQMEGNDEQCRPQVAEADAKETCWAFCEAFDAPPPSVDASFGSYQSVQLSMRPADREWRRSMTPSSILKNRQPQPISPLSEFHPQRPAQGRNRTVSASFVDPVPSGSSKRRLNSSPVKLSSAPQDVSRAPSASILRSKRRRVSSSSHRSDDVAQEAQVTIWANTPRRSREPPSPFFSSEPQLPRTNSDLASRPSQRSAGGVGKSTPFAYATPHSGPFMGDAGFRGPGDTEADDDLYQDDDDGEQSWRGVTTGEDDSASEDDAEAGAEDEPASFSGDDSGFGTDYDEDDDSGEEEDGFAAQRREDEEDGDDDDDLFDTMLSVLR